RAPIKKSREARWWPCTFSWRSGGNPVKKTGNHDQRDERRIPKNPVVREVLPVPNIQRRRDVHRSVHGSRVQSHRKRKIRRGNIPQRKSKGQWIERSRGKSSEYECRYQETVAVNQW